MAKPVNQTAEVSLQEPVTINVGGKDETHSVLRVRPPRVADMLILDDYEGQKIAGMIALTAALCEVPELVIKRLAMSDFERVSEVVGNFMPVGPKTGKRSRAT